MRFGVVACGLCVCILSVYFIYIIVISLTKNKNENCPDEALVNLSSLSSEIRKNDENLSKGITINGTHYPPEALYIRKGEILGCPCATRTCVPLCCPQNHIFKRGKCITSNRTTPISFPTMYDSKNLTPLNTSWEKKEVHTFVYNPCSRYNNSNNGMEVQILRLSPKKYKGHAFRFLNDGTISMYLERKKKNYDEYCFGDVKLREYEDEYSVVFCGFQDENNKWLYIYSILILLSVPFFVITFIVYMILPELRNLHGLSFSCYVACLTIAYISLGITNILPSNYESIVLCKSCGK